MDPLLAGQDCTKPASTVTGDFQPMNGRRCAVAQTVGRKSNRRWAVDSPLGEVALIPEACAVFALWNMNPALDMDRLGKRLMLLSAAAEV